MINNTGRSDVSALQEPPGRQWDPSLEYWATLGNAIGSGSMKIHVFAFALPGWQTICEQYRNNLNVGKPKTQGNSREAHKKHIVISGNMLIQMWSINL